MHPRFQTDVDLAVTKAVENVIDNRLTVRQVCELAEQYATTCVVSHCSGERSDVDDRNDARERLYRAIRANHRDAKP